MAYFNSLGTEIPGYLWELGLAVRRLIDQYDAMDMWRRHVRRWVELDKEAAEKPKYRGVDVMNLPLSLKIDAKYALLAAVHDNCASPERIEELIDPWAAEADFGGPDEVVLKPEALAAIATYVGLMQHVLPEHERRGIDPSNGDRLHDILQDVANDIRNTAKLWVPDRSSCSDAPADRDPVEKYASFLRRADTQTGTGGSTTQAKQDDETADDNGQPPAATPTDAADDERTGFLGGKDLADALTVHPSRCDAFFRQLERKRLDLGDDNWNEIREPRPNSPRFLYRADSPKILDLAAAYKQPKSA